MELSFCDLFAGLGGMRLGFEQGCKKNNVKSRCLFTSEIKESATKVYKENFKNSVIYGDITQVNVSSIPNVDVLLAGFPCQPFSTAGKRQGFYDTRGTLFFDINRIIKGKKDLGTPIKAFILENVEGLVNHNNGRTLKIILSNLETCGYCVTYKVLDSQYFGLAQRRKRVYIVGTLHKHILLDDFTVRGVKFQDIVERGLPTITSDLTSKLLKLYTCDELQGKCIQDKRGGSRNIHSWELGLKGPVTCEQQELLNKFVLERRKKKWAVENKLPCSDGVGLTIEQIRSFYNNTRLDKLLSDLVEKGYLKCTRLQDQQRNIDKNVYNIKSGKLSYEFTQILSEATTTPTLVATDIAKLGVVDGRGLRHLSVVECQRLMGINEKTYDMSMLNIKEVYDLIGNSVCIPVIADITERVVASLINGAE